ncbi:MAG: rhomboid family intramembrane serine protease [Myxococcales bacterium]|nr:rhomboid family intramembrane serine protease [Myxococcales bacterium]
MSPARTLLLSVVTRLVDDPDLPARLLALSDEAAILVMADKSLTALMTPAHGPPEALQARLRALVEDHPGMHIKVALVGGGPEIRAVMPRGGGGLWARRAIQLFHLFPLGPGDDDWALWTSGGARPDSPLGRVLEQAARGELPTPDPQALAQRVVAPPPLSKDERAQLDEHQAFVEGLRVRPRATLVVLGVLALIFGCEAWWGGTESLLTLVRMGGNTDAALSGEPWRLLSSALLHAGIVHIGLNGYVLWVLGGFMEKVLGPARYGVLLGVAALGGGLASALLSSALVSVGASGAIWGVLGAAAALAWRPGTVIPTLLVVPLRRNAMINLVLGLTVSFLPQVDLWAHLGGGVAGAALVLGGVVTRGVGRPARAAAHVEEGEAKGGQAPRRDRLALAGGLVAATMLAALATAWVVGRPWALAGELQWSRQGLAPGVAPELPTLLGDAHEHEPGAGERAWSAGDWQRDPLTVDVVLTELDAPTRRANLALYAGQGPTMPAGTTVHQPWHARRAGGWPTYAIEYAYPAGFIGGYWVQVRDDAELSVHTLRWPEPSDRWGQAVERILASLEDDAR